MSSREGLWYHLITKPNSEYILRTAMWRVACGLSEVTGHQIRSDHFRMEEVPLARVPERAGSPEDEVVGVYLLTKGDLLGQAIMILSVPSALKLAEWLIGDASGRTELGELERSALAEMGNLAISRFLNCVAVHTGWARLLRPSAPGVMVNMLGAILDVVVAPVAVSVPAGVMVS